MSRDVADLSPGTVLRAGFTGDDYVILRSDGEQVVARGPEGPVAVPRTRLNRDIADGRVEVVS